jgi:hypothetical protein
MEDGPGANASGLFVRTPQQLTTNNCQVPSVFVEREELDVGIGALRVLERPL